MQASLDLPHLACDKHQIEDFDALFNLLARRPDQEMRFRCDLVR